MSANNPSSEDEPVPPTTTKKPEYVMPRPPAIVAWKNAPGVPDSYAVVTAYGKNAVGVMVFPPESRVGVPKDNVRYVGDPRNATSGINPDSGVWDYTTESLELAELKTLVAMLIPKAAVSK